MQVGCAKVKALVDNKRPAKQPHMRQKDFKEQLFRKREMQIENNHLVAKILQVKSTNPIAEERRKDTSFYMSNNSKQFKVKDNGQSYSPTRRSLNSLNFIQRKNNLEKIMQENIYMMKKIHFAQPSVQYTEHLQHQREVKKLKKLVQYNSLRQSMITSVRNFFSGYENMNSLDDRAMKRLKTAQSQMTSNGMFLDHQHRVSSVPLSRRKKRRLIQSLDVTSNNDQQRQTEGESPLILINQANVLPQISNNENNMSQLQNQENTENQLQYQQYQDGMQMNQTVIQSHPYQNTFAQYGAYNITSQGTVSNITGSGHIRPVSATLSQIKYWKQMQSLQNSGGPFATFNQSQKKIKAVLRQSQNGLQNVNKSQSQIEQQLNGQDKSNLLSEREEKEEQVQQQQQVQNQDQDYNEQNQQQQQQSLSNLNPLVTQSNNDGKEMLQEAKQHLYVDGIFQANQDQTKNSQQNRMQEINGNNQIQENNEEAQNDQQQVKKQKKQKKHKKTKSNQIPMDQYQPKIKKKMMFF
ncbi:UNKNOWN [Stylonychia lemnae]|uniref:Uncharacterized protein n=1 Tax=Stylonychia lemnae TaxID=5949 RepID=A0A078AW01_STYLE|nr:UNKNOWN [Stylonychia lemnae]|eukprot:CDW84958.1 UNKNOWN [Stylonychia lemnae]